MKQLDPKAVWLFLLGSNFWLFAIAGVWFSLWPMFLFEFETDHEALGILGWTWLFIPFAIVMSWVWSKLTYRFYFYELREDGFRKELGVIYKRYVTIPYDRIQNVDINRGILDRLLGLSSLNIHTAGVGGIASGEGRLPGLSKEIAEELRDELVARARSSRSNQGL